MLLIKVNWIKLGRNKQYFRQQTPLKSIHIHYKKHLLCATLKLNIYLINFHILNLLAQHMEYFLDIGRAMEVGQ